jgi:CDGSH-type Zn-finger protein
MARIVRHESTGPTKIDPSTLPLGPDGKPKNIFICACGLSSTFPICDGSHKKCVIEEPGFVYIYNPLTKEVIEKRPES